MIEQTVKTFEMDFYTCVSFFYKNAPNIKQLKLNENSICFKRFYEDCKML